MNPLSNIPSSPPSLPAGQRDFLSFPDPAVAAFDRLIDRILRPSHSPSSASQAAIAAEQRKSEFQHKLAMLTCMVDQARIAVNSSVDNSGHVDSAKQQQYFFLKSKLSQVGLPDGVNNLI